MEGPRVHCYCVPYPCGAGAARMCTCHGINRAGAQTETPNYNHKRPGRMPCVYSVVEGSSQYVDMLPLPLISICPRAFRL